MSNDKQSSVEWQHVELIRIDYQYAINKITPREYQEQTKNALQQAKAMHKEEMVQFVNDYFLETDSSIGYPNAEIFYNETYGGNK